MCLDDFTHTRRDFIKLSALLTAGGAMPLLSSLQARAASDPDAPVRIGPFASYYKKDFFLSTSRVRRG